MGGHVLDRVVSANRWGVIFSAHLRDGPQRALGILDPALMAIPGLADAFLRAAEEARHRTDPRLVRVYGSGVERQLAWLASEWLEGHDGHCVLRRCRAGEALPLRYALSLALQATQAVQALHAVGTAHATQHGRLALDKLFLCTDGRFKLIGIGLPSIGHEAWPLPDDVDHFAALAPEQISDGVVSPASDIYTLGVLTVTLISGANPLQRRTIAQTTEAILAGESMPRGDRRHIPGSLAMRLGGALALNPQDRFPSVAELAAELSAELDMAGGAVTQAEWVACLRERFPADTGSVDGLREITLEQRSARVLQVLTMPLTAPVVAQVAPVVVAPAAAAVTPVAEAPAAAPLVAAVVAPVAAPPVVAAAPIAAPPVRAPAAVATAAPAPVVARAPAAVPTEEGPRVSRYVVVAAALLFLSIVGGGGMWAVSLRPTRPVASTPATAPVVVSEPTPVAAEPVASAAPVEPTPVAPVEAVPAEPVATAAPVETAAPVVSAPPVEAPPKVVKATKEPVKAAKPVAAATPVKAPPPATKPAPATPTATAPTAPTAAKPVAIAPTPAPAAAKLAAIATPSAPAATPPTASVAASFLEDLSVDVTANKVLLTGTLSGAAVRPWHYLAQDAGPDGATRYIVKLKGTANRGGVKRLPVAAPGVRGVSVQQDAAGLVLVVDCDCTDESPVQMSKLADGFQLTIPTN